MKREGFTLLEILVAISILVIIILIVSGVFHQSQIAWETGLRKTSLNMEGRAALSLMSQELGSAVAGPYFTNSIAHNATVLGFWSFGSASNNQRVAQYITYQKVGDIVRREIRRAEEPYPKLGPSDGLITLIENVDDLRFTTSDGLTHTTNLPPWIGVRFTLRKGEKYSRIRVWSLGPDGDDSTGDELKSWEDSL